VTFNILKLREITQRLDECLLRGGKGFPPYGLLARDGGRNGVSAAVNADKINLQKPYPQRTQRKLIITV